MKSLFLTFAIMLASQTALAVTKVTIDDVSKKVKDQNFLVLEKAKRVYQANKSISMARRGLLPRLNLWRIAKIFIEPTALLGNGLDMIGDIAPFLIPSNWFRVKQNKILYEAEQEAYVALWANEIMTAKAVYVRVLMDRDLYKFISENVTALDNLVEIAQSRAELGFEKPEVARELEVQLLGFKDDQRQMALLLQEELSLLTYLMGFPASEQIELADLNLPDPTGFPTLNSASLEAQMLKESPERKQFDHLVRVVPSIKKEVAFSFLGASSISRGVAGGIFDHLPVMDGLGFDAAPAMKIISKEKEVLKIQRQGIEETLKRQLQGSEIVYDSIQKSFAQLQRRQYLADSNFNQQTERVILGQPININEFALNIHQRTLSRSATLEAQYKFVSNLDKLDRLTFEGDYKAKPKAPKK